MKTTSAMVMAISLSMVSIAASQDLSKDRPIVLFKGFASTDAAVKRKAFAELQKCEAHDLPEVLKLDDKKR